MLTKEKERSVGGAGGSLIKCVSLAGDRDPVLGEHHMYPHDLRRHFALWVIPPPQPHSFCLAQKFLYEMRPTLEPGAERAPLPFTAAQVSLHTGLELQDYRNTCPSAKLSVLNHFPQC
ncbi:hypothetical protein SKAU_G00048260 [Synaphobranchus kaupii]|uniref:Uncharacterized protein n=1 Tax=Synaphobranchus kaupii TaxID=118154 RepID=A0A9Q1G2X4_SYNKA|nr:hypothetical protein SKAU_G00048260 [Synaphobranchus kaupii]